MSKNLRCLDIDVAKVYFLIGTTAMTAGRRNGVVYSRRRPKGCRMRSDWKRDLGVLLLSAPGWSPESPLLLESVFGGPHLGYLNFGYPKFEIQNSGTQPWGTQNFGTHIFGTQLWFAAPYLREPVWIKYYPLAC